MPATVIAFPMDRAALARAIIASGREPDDFSSSVDRVLSAVEAGRQAVLRVGALVERVRSLPA